MKARTYILLLAYASLPAHAASSAAVTAAEFGANWPFIVDRGTVACHPEPGLPNVQLVTFTDPAGNTYAVNGAASSRASKRGWFNVQSIWKANPAIPGTKIPITPIIQRGTALCGS